MTGGHKYVENHCRDGTICIANTKALPNYCTVDTYMCKIGFSHNVDQVFT